MISEKNIGSSSDSVSYIIMIVVYVPFRCRRVVRWVRQSLMESSPGEVLVVDCGGSKVRWDTIERSRRVWLILARKADIAQNRTRIHRSLLGLIFDSRRGYYEGDKVSR